MRGKLFIFCIFLFCTVSATASTDSSLIEIIEGKDFNGLTIKEIEKPTAYELSVIKFILKNTYELNIHKMRGEENNSVYLHKDGHKEVVYDENGDLVTNYNQGSFNFYSYSKEPIAHYMADIYPWLKWGSFEGDPTSYEERLFYYTLDLNLGIQAYIFNESEELPRVFFFFLTKKEKAVYKFFKYILFNKNYKIQLDKTTKKKLKESAEDYWTYFGEIQNLLGVKQE